MSEILERLEAHLAKFNEEERKRDIANTVAKGTAVGVGGALTGAGIGALGLGAAALKNKKK